VADAARELAEQIASGAAAPDAVFIEDLALYLNTAADGPLQDLLKAARANGVFVVTDCETSSLASWPLHMAAKAGRHGVALQPDQHDGDNVFKTPFPRVARADFPPGRGFYVRRGQFRRFQSALPEVDAT
jgi:S-DNA-T family DNA segregation ATPase FtsK/SpoIIIE